MNKGKLYELPYRAAHTVFSEAELEELIDEAKKEFEQIDASSPWAEEKWDDLKVWFEEWFGDKECIPPIFGIDEGDREL